MVLTRRLAIGVLAAAVAIAARSGSSGNRSAGLPITRSIGGKSPSPSKASMERLAKEDPHNKYAWYNLGVIAEDDHDSNTAAADYTKAIAIDPRFEAAFYSLGDLRLHAGAYSSAIALLTRAVAITPDDARAHLDLGRALAHVHTVANDQRSKAELHKATDLDPALLDDSGA